MKTKNRLSMKLVVLGLSLAALPRISFGAPANEDEWYDPSDWFDNNNVESDDSFDGYDYTYDDIDDNDYYDGYWEGLIWYDDYDAYDDYDIDYAWDPVDDEWVTDFDYGYDYDYSETSTASNQQNDSTQSSQPQTLKGTVEAFTQISLGGQTGITQEHALARISLDKGGSAVVDLGSTSFLTADLQKGDEVTLEGQKGQIDGQTVFVAQRLESNGETVYIDRAIAMNQAGQSDQQSQSQSNESRQTSSAKYKMDSEKSQSSSNASQSQSKDGEHLVLEGKIDRLETVKLSGENEDRQRLARIQLQNGEAATVSFGSEKAAEKLALEKGDQVRIEGTTKKIEGRTVLMAEYVKLQT